MHCKVFQEAFQLIRNWRIMGVEACRKFIWQACGVSYGRKVFGAHFCHYQTYQPLLHPGPGLPTPSQFDILNNYWICHQTKHRDTKSCVNLWLLPLNYVWLNELFIRRKWKRKKATANMKRKKERVGNKTMDCKWNKGSKTEMLRKRVASCFCFGGSPWTWQIRMSQSIQV